MLEGFFKITLAVLCSLITVTASGSVIVDTGSPALTSNGTVAVIPTQWMGIRINILDSYNITDVRSYFYAPPSGYGTLTASLYNEIDGLPGSELYTQEFSIFNSTLESPIKDWFGVNGINWIVSSGNYWLTYEVRGSQTYTGGLEISAPTLLPVAVKTDFFTNWTVLSGHGFGLIVEGNLISAVPEPKTYVLLLAGLGVMGFVTSRRLRMTLSVQSMGSNRSGQTRLI